MERNLSQIVLTTVFKYEAWSSLSNANNTQDILEIYFDGGELCSTVAKPRVP